MGASIHRSGDVWPLDKRCATVLQAIQELGIDFSAPCGGNGSCGNCAVWVQDGTGLHRELACRLVPSDDMQVHLDVARPLEIELSGHGHHVAPASTDVSGYGVAIDLGTTTLVCRLYDLADGRCLGALGATNPQLSHGADVISRIQACKEGKLELLQRQVLLALDRMIERLCEDAGVPRTAVRHAVVVGNTIMEHIAAGLSPVSIGLAPFTPLSTFGSEARLASDLPQLAERTWFAPAVSGYVGGDICADILDCNLQAADGKLRLMLDLGTNGEMVLAGDGRMLACATAAGPVFEGAGIAYGLPAVPGAIAHVAYDDEDGGFMVESIDDAPAFGICGSGVISTVASLREAGFLAPNGRMQGVAAASGRVCLTPQVAFTQKDVRNVQLAKGAIAAGIEVLLAAYGAEPADVDELLIAGGFGRHLDIAAAVSAGLIPRELAARTRAVGNSAIEGASSLLLGGSAAQEEARRAAAQVEYIELSGNHDFDSRFIRCLDFPL
ncbi:MAG: DUF4445 domain-containing protein [Coriobacteriales bacterium]|nr:DUF4445 domain-containing protein [Coriobacteriales bacterium]